jgi:phenylacetate-CoA ligase
MKGRFTYRCFDLVSRRRVLRSFEELLERQSWDADRLSAYMADRLRDLLEHARARVPHFRALASKIDSWDLASIPPLTKQDLLDHSRDLLSEGADLSFMRRASSGGSTGTPATFHLDRATLDSQSASMLRHRTWMDLDLICPHALLWGPPPDEVSYGTLGGRLRGLFLRRRFFPTYALDADGAERIRRALRRSCPPLVEGYSSALDLVAAGAPPLEHCPRVVLTGAETLYPAQERRLATFFGAPIFQRYGCNEFNAIAHSCRKGSLHVNSDRLVVEILRADGVPARPGEIGTTIVTDLDNWGMPLIRFDLGDALEAGGDCDCGLPFPTVAAVHGRCADLIPGAGGRLVSPRHVSQALDACGEILEHQVRFKAQDPLEIHLRAIGSIDLKAARLALSSLFDREVRARRSDSLERWPSGKVKPTIHLDGPG